MLLNYQEQVSGNSGNYSVANMALIKKKTILWYSLFDWKLTNNLNVVIK